MRSKILKFLSVFLLLSILVITPSCSNNNNDVNEEDAIQEGVDQEEVDQEEIEEEEIKEEEKELSEEEVKALEILEGISTEGGLKDVYEQVDIVAGTCLSDIMIRQESFENIILDNFTSITLENNMKPDALLNHNASKQAGEIVVTFPQRTTSLLDWAKENGLSVRGHTLVWYSQTPDWIYYEDFDTSKEFVDRDTMLERMESFIKQVFEQLEELGYIEMFYAYDVVNEAILDDGSLRKCQWLDIIGDDYIWYAFYYADKYAPDYIKLYYNDFNEQFKTKAIMDLAESLVDEDGQYLIDGIGCQGHLYTRDSIKDYMKMLESFSSLGIDVQITELDISLGTWQNILQPTEENLLDQGRYYYDLISKIVVANDLGQTSVSGITFWGFSDNLSWRSDRHPLLFNSMLQPKYSYYGAKLERENAGY